MGHEQQHYGRIIRCNKSTKSAFQAGKRCRNFVRKAFVPLILRSLLPALFYSCFYPSSAHAQAPITPTLDKILHAPALKGGVTGAMVCRVATAKRCMPTMPICASCLPRTVSS